jgi:hypothetical protein
MQDTTLVSMKVDNKRLTPIMPVIKNEIGSKFFVAKSFVLRLFMLLLGSTELP